MMTSDRNDWLPYVSLFGVFLLFGSLILWRLPNVPEYAAPALAVVGALLALAWPVLNPGEMRELMSGRRIRHGGNSFVLALSALGILVVLNFLAARWYYTQDVTENQRLSISDQTRQILDDIDDAGEPVVVTAVLASNDPSSTDLDRLIEQYESNSEAVEIERVDPQLEPFALTAIEERIGEAPPTNGMIAESAGRHAVVFSSFDEQAITEVIVKATRAEEKTIAFISGHEEYDPAGSEEGGYLAISEQLGREGFTVETMSLSTMTDTLSADAVVIAGPRRPYLEEEVQALEGYLRDGGAVMVLLDPDTDVGLDQLFAPYGITVRDDLVLDPERSFLGQGPQIPAIVGDGYLFHTITKDLVAKNITSAIPGARSIEVGTPQVETISASPLLQTSAAAWGESNIESLSSGVPTLDPGEDTPGPLTLGVAAEDSAEGGYGRLVVFGNAQLASDGFLQGMQMLSLGNGNLVLNGINWLTQDEALISIRPTAPETRSINPVERPWLLLLTTTLFMPALVASVGFWVWWRQR